MLKKRLRNTLLLVVLGTSMLLDSSIVARTRDTDFVSSTTEVNGASDVTEADVGSVETTEAGEVTLDTTEADDGILDTTETDSSVSAFTEPDVDVSDSTETYPDYIAAIDVSNETTQITDIYNEHRKSLLSKNAPISQKCSDLLAICYCQISELYLNGEISFETYVLQREPFFEETNNLLTASEEEVLDCYKSLLLYLYDTMYEDKVAGFEIDQTLYDFILDEIDTYCADL